jgi:hypothetical protein
MGDARATTGTALDEFLPIYVALAMPTKTHGALSPADVDAMDLSVVAALLGVGNADNLEGEAAQLNAARLAAAAEGRPFSWDDT